MIQRKWYIALIMFFAFMPISYGVVRTINLSSSSQVSGTLAIANGGTGGTTASAARTALGLANYTASDSSWTNGEVLTISHGSVNNVMVTGYSSATAIEGTLTANWTNAINADTGQTATANNGAAISGGWLDFDGTNDYLTFADDAAYSLGSGNFTLEFDTQFDTTSGQSHIANHAGPGELYSWAFIRNGTNLFCFASSSTNRDVLNDVSFGTVGTGTTYQVALVRSGTHFYGYLNGTRIFDQTSSSTLLNPDGVMVFGRPSSVSTEYLNGRIRRFRLTVGTALYTGSSYTPPSADYTGETTYTGLRHGTDYTYTFDTSGTYVTNASGGTLSTVRFDVLPSN